MDSNDKWHYSDEFYQIIDREPRDGDEDIHIVRELMSDEVADKFDKMIASLKPNEKYDDKEYWPITTESGKIKFIRGNARMSMIVQVISFVEVSLLKM